MKRITLIIFLIAGHLLFSQSQSKYQSIILPNNLTNNANAIVRLDSMTVELVSQNKMVTSMTRIVTILNELGEKHIHGSVGYDNSRTIKSVEAIVYNSFGKEIKKIRKRDFKDVSAFDGFSLYSDNRVLYLDYTPTSYPYTIKFTYKVETPNTVFLPSWYFIDGYNVSVEESQFNIIYNSDELKLRYKEKNFEEFEITTNEQNGNLHFYAKNIEAIRREDLSPVFKEFIPMVLIASDKFHADGIDGNANNWGELGKWMYDKILAGRQDLSTETISIVKSLVQDVEDPLKRAEIVYEYVQKNTRYISVQVGIGGYQPIAAIDVDKVKYGDCKGLSNYTKALLDIVGVESYYTHVEAGSEKIDFEEDFASLSQGNHAILSIPYNDQLYWIDCTSQIHPFNFIGDFTDDRNVLIMKPEGGEIVKTNSYKNEENYQKTIGEYFLDGVGNIEGTVQIKTTGVQYDNRFKIESNSKEDNVKRYKEYLDNINNLSINNFSFENNKKDIEFTEKIELSATDYASTTGDRLIFVVNAFNKNSYVPSRYRNRKLSLQINRGYLDEDEFILHTPKGYDIEAFPNDELIENKFGTYQIQFIKNEDNTVTYKRKLFIKEGAYPKEDYDSYRDFRKDVSRLDNSKIVLIKKT